MPSPSDPITLKGPQLQPPPPEFAASIVESVQRFADATLAQDQRGGLVGVLHRKGDQVAMNLAIVQRIGDHSTVVGWVAKDWGEPIGVGAGWTIRW